MSYWWVSWQGSIGISYIYIYICIYTFEAKMKSSGSIRVVSVSELITTAAIFCQLEHTNGHFLHYAFTVLTCVRSALQDTGQGNTHVSKECCTKSFCIASTAPFADVILSKAESGRPHQRQNNICLRYKIYHSHFLCLQMYFDLLRALIMTTETSIFRKYLFQQIQEDTRR
jgi:hypothetical protein